jgi:N-acetylmuramoyl-L-alanine amidase
MKKLIIFVFVVLMFGSASAQTIQIQTLENKKNEIVALTSNIYHESRGEPKLGKYMVGYVTINRVLNPKFPNTIYGVVVDRRQFSWYNGRDCLIPQNLNVKQWKECYEIAIDVLQNIAFDPTFGALYFHTVDVNPKWAKEKQFIIRVGNHKFYK